MSVGRLREWNARQPAPLAYALAHAVQIAHGSGHALVGPEHLLVALGFVWAPLRERLGQSWPGLVAAAEATPPAPEPPAPEESSGGSVCAAAALREAFLHAGPEVVAAHGGVVGQYRADVRRAVRAAWCASALAGVERANAVHLVRAVLAAPPDRVVDLLSRAGTTPARLLRETPVEAACRVEAYPVDWAATFLDRRGRLHPQWYSRRRRLWTRLSDLPRDLRGGRWPGISDVSRALAAGGHFQSRRLGHAWLGCAHTVVALLALDDYLAATGRHIPPAPPGDLNEGARVLAAHGVTYANAFESAAALPVDHREYRLGPRQLPGTAILAEAAEAAEAMRQLAARRRHPYIGTTALLMAGLRVPGSTAAALLHAMDVDPRAVLAEAARRLPG
ncbi:hypothetical protein K1W54_15330 [Micromonospora sp. CPCC 205371]|nr:hypothetical protein [Micromonospora sp. CPCC 205371]